MVFGMNGWEGEEGGVVGIYGETVGWEEVRTEEDMVL